MSKSGALATVIALAVLFAVGGTSAYSATKTVKPQLSNVNNAAKVQEAKNVIKVKSLIKKHKGEKGQDLGATVGTAAVGAGADAGLKAGNTKKLFEANRAAKAELYKESPEAKK